MDDLEKAVLAGLRVTSKQHGAQLTNSSSRRLGKKRKRPQPVSRTDEPKDKEFDTQSNPDVIAKTSKKAARARKTKLGQEFRNSAAKSKKREVADKEKPEEENHIPEAGVDYGTVAEDLKTVKLVGVKFLVAGLRERWEPVALGRLARLICQEWDLQPKQTYKFLKKYCPELLTAEFLEGLEVTLKPRWLLRIVQSAALLPQEAMRRIIELVEAELIDLHRDEDLELLAAVMEGVWEHEDIVDYALKLCECTREVSNCLRVVKSFSEHWGKERTTELVEDIVRAPFFKDLEGKRSLIIEEFPELKPELRRLVEEEESDADEDGNLKGFIVGDSEESASDGEEERSGEEKSENEDRVETDSDEVLTSSDEEPDGSASSEGSEAEERKAEIELPKPGRRLKRLRPNGRQ